MAQAMSACEVQGQSYADALRDRLGRVRAELQVQERAVLDIRTSISIARSNVEVNKSELCGLRLRWTAEQPEREVLLRDAGEREHELVERERHCVEALAAHTLADRAQQAEGTVQDGEAGSEVHEVARSRGTSKSEPSGRQGERDREQRQRLELLTETRSKLSSALHDLRSAAQQESVEIQQLRTRNEALRKESDALRASANAACERETQLKQKLEGLQIGAASRQQRQQLLERRVVELQAEVQGLQAELVAAAKAPACNPTTTTLPSNAVNNDEATWAANRLLEAKVASLREQLRQRQAAA